MRPEELLYPIIVVDDDQWMYVYSSSGQLVREIEPAFLDDITATFDGLARSLGFALDETSEGVLAELQSPDSGLTRLQLHVDEFFTTWTQDEPPERVSDPGEYTTSVSQAYQRKRERRKKNA